MTDDNRQGARLDDDSASMTQTLRMLAVPSASANDDVGRKQGSALVLCRDAEYRKWAARWLTRDGLRVNVADRPETGLELARETKPEVIIIEAALRDLDGASLYRAIEAATDVAAHQIVLCASAREAAAALESDVFDVTRKPFEWSLVSRRARSAARLKQNEIELRQRGESLAKAVSLAESARQALRSRDSVDPLTGMPNQSRFIMLAGGAMRAVDRDDCALAVSVIGFNRFRLVIEAMGQEQANAVLAEAGRKILDAVERISDIVDQQSGFRTAAAANLDSFRFALLTTCDGDDDRLRKLQQRLLELLSEPVKVAGQTVYLSPCIGTALYPQDADSADTLLQRADNAMREAQARGGGYRFYCATMDAAAANKLRIEHMLHEALEREELTLVYQPIVAGDTGKLLAAEALVRWPQPDGSFIPPGDFIPIAEESDLILRVGEFVLDEACRQLAAWHQAGLRVPRVCVNVAKGQLVAHGFINTVTGALRKHGLSPAQLELEISERGVITGDSEVIERLGRIYDLGVRLAVDDFGAGDAAIAYLKELPVHVLKLDRSYTGDLSADDKDQAIVSAAIVLGQKLDLNVVAEGVETREQLDLLRQLDCEAVQGFLISHPVPSDEFEALLDKPQDKQAPAI